MKKLFTKSGQWFNVKLDPSARGRMIILFTQAETMIAVIREPKLCSVSIHIKEPQQFEILAIAEIIENFDFFWNNLNQ